MFVARLRFAAVVVRRSSLCVLGLMAGTAGAAELDALSNQQEVVEILQLIEAATRDNFQKISTWRGTFKFESRKYDDAPRDIEPNGAWDGEAYWRNSSGIGGFVYDSVSESRRLSHETTELSYSSARSGEAIPFETVAVERAMVLTPQHLLRLKRNLRYGRLGDFPCTRKSGPIGYRKATALPREAAPLGGILYDPIQLFGNGTMAAWEWCALYSSSIKSGKLPDEQLSRIMVRREPHGEGETFVFVVTYNQDNADPENALVVTQVFDVEAQYNLVEWRKSRRGIIYESRETAYRTEGEICIPTNVLMKRFDRPSGTLVKEEVYELTESSLNAPIAASEFDWTAMQPWSGTRIVDEIEGELKIYQNGSLVPCQP